MKKIVILSLFLIIGLFTHLFFWGNSRIKVSPNIVDARYVFIAPLGNADFRKLVATGIQSADAEFSTDTKLIACTNIDVFCNKIYESIYSKVDGIILTCPGYSAELVKAIAKARDAGIPVILADNKIQNIEYDGFLGIDNYCAGCLAAEILYKSTKIYNRTVVILSDPTVENQMERYNGFYDTWKKLTGQSVWTVVNGEGEYSTLKREIEKIYSGYSGDIVFFCGEATSSMYLQDVLDALNKTSSSIVGFDTLDESLAHVSAEKYIAIIGQDTASMGYEAVAYLQQCKAGQRVWGQDIEVSVSVINKDNVNRFFNSGMNMQEWSIE